MSWATKPYCLLPLAEEIKGPVVQNSFFLKIKKIKWHELKRSFNNEGDNWICTNILY